MDDVNIFPEERRPRRRRKTKAELFKEAYLPYLILLAAAVLIVCFIIGALARTSKNETPDTAQTALCETLEV